MKKIFIILLLSIMLLFFYLKVTTEYIYTTIAIETPFENLENTLNTQIEVIKSQTIIIQVLEELNISKENIADIQQIIFVKQIKNSSILKIYISKKATSKAKDILSSLSNIYITHYNQQSKDSQLAPLERIDSELQKVDNHIKELTLTLEKFRENNHYIVTNTVAKTKVTTLDSLQNRLLEITIELDIFNRLYKQLQRSKKIDKLLVGGIYTSKKRENKVLEDSIMQLQQSIIQRKILLADYTKEYPEVIKLKRKILELRSITVGIIKNSTKSYTQEKRLLEEYIKKEKIFIEKIPHNDRVVSSLKEQLYTNRKLYNLLLEKKLNTTIKNTKSSRAYIIDKEIDSSYAKDNFYLQELFFMIEGIL